MIFDPIPAVDGMLLAVKFAKLPDPKLGEALAAFDARKRATKSSDREGMKLLYGDCLALMEQVLHVHRAASQKREAEVSSQRAAQQAAQVGNAVVGVLEKAKAAWSERLDVQVRELLTKVDHSVAKLDIEGKEDDASGQTTFRITDGHRDGFVKYLGDLEGKWLSNNQALVAQRANEALSEVLEGTPKELSFEVQPPKALAPRPLDLRLKGATIVTPSAFSTLDGAYKIVMAVTGAVSGIGFLASRVLGNEIGKILPWVFGGAFLVAVFFAVKIAPKRHRQAMARLLEQQKDRVHKELDDAAAAHVRFVAEEQKRALRKHLDDEAARFRAITKPLVAASRESLGSVPSLGGLSAGDVAKLEGEWRTAVAGRLAELGLGATSRSESRRSCSASWCRRFARSWRAGCRNTRPRSRPGCSFSSDRICRWGSCRSTSTR